MIGIDTNVLVRFLVADDKAQAAKAKRFMERRCSEKMPGYINLIVLCELAWVLKKGYGYNREEIAQVLEGLLRARSLAIEEAAVVWTATKSYSKGGADFPDHLIGFLNSSRGCATTITMDRKASRLTQFSAI